MLDSEAFRRWKRAPLPASRPAGRKAVCRPAGTPLEAKAAPLSPAGRNAAGSAPIAAAPSAWRLRKYI